ncbi:MAG1360 family OppF-related protein [Mycoplasma sp. Ms02]|uniref:MAG1360 family OppF-related protein n=1 Tax=Mycoplasma sp. Ms02 TaxID=353851 RepID=UPI001C89D49C|nr:hypothetical protein [Mycoplasma sp. Ms02]QZE12350.1 hypothetical protein K4L35_03390 [Mycoplasma sp. Ms02]
MNSSKNFTIENFFFNKDENGKNRVINIPWLTIYSDHKTAIFIDKNTSNYLRYHFWSSLNSNPYAVYRFERNDSMDYFLDYGADSLARNVAYFDMNEIHGEDSDIPLFDIWQKAWSTSRNMNERVRNMQEVFKRYEIPLKSSILSKFTQYSDAIIDENNDIIREMTNILKSIEEKWFTMNDSEYLESLETILENLEYYKNAFAEHHFRFYNEVFEIYDKYKEFYRRGSEEDPIYKIKEAELKLKNLKRINNTSLKKVEAEFKIKDLNVEINFYKDFLKQRKTKSNNIVNFVAYKMKNEIKVLKQKMAIVDSNSKEYLYLNKRLVVKKRSLSLWKTYSRKVKYLKSNDLDNIHENMKNEEKLFIENNLAFINNPYKGSNWFSLFWKAKKDFFFDFDNYFLQSQTTKNEIKKEIKERKKKIKVLNRVSYKKIENTMLELNQKTSYSFMKQIQAEEKWNLKSSDRLFKTTLKNIGPKVKRFITNKQKSEKEIPALFKRLNRNLNQKASKNAGLQDIVKKLRAEMNLIDDLKKFALTDHFLVSLCDFITSRKMMSESFWNNLVITRRILNLMNYASVNFKNYLSSYDEIASINRIKLKLVALMMKRPSLILLQDTDANITKEQKHEFMRVLSIITKDNEIQYAIVTDSLNTVLNYSTFTYVFSGDNLIEAAETAILSRYAKTKYANTAFISNEEKYKYSAKISYMWIYGGFYRLKKDLNHFVYSVSEDLLKSSSKNKNEILSKFIHTEEHIINSENVNTFLDPVIVHAQTEMFDNKDLNTISKSDMID